MEGPELWSVDYLRECFRYDKETGHLYWKERPREHFKTNNAHSVANSRCAGERADYSCPNGYRRVSIGGVSSKAHRVIFLMENGYLPEYIDHINNVRDDNRIENLRAATPKENSRNIQPRKGGSSKYKGVRRRRGKFEVSCGIGEYHYIGTYEDEIEAAIAYDKYVSKYTFAALNRNFFKEVRERSYPVPWLEYPKVWKTKASFFSWLRGNLRRALWNKSPVKIQFKNEQCSPPPAGYTGRAKTGAVCSLTGEWFPKSQLEVDHIGNGGTQLRDWDDLEPFIRHLCCGKDNLQLVSKEAHKIKSYAERKGISFEEAILEKEVIKFSKKKADEQKRMLKLLGVKEEFLTSAAKRKQAMREILQGGNDAYRKSVEDT